MSSNTILFSPLSLPNSGLTLKNRLVVSPMCQYSAEDGFANDWHLVHLGSRAVSGVSAVIQEATAVSPEGRITYGDLGIWEDGHITALHRITAFLKQQGAIPGIQLAHAGRKASAEKPWLGGKQIKAGKHAWRPLAPSAIPFAKDDDAPQAMDNRAITKVIRDFVEAARRAVRAGYQLIEIHAAHGYLLHQFLSPLSNQRTDGYGGPFENRIRLLIEVVDAVASAIPKDVSLWVRLSATDWVADGWDLPQSIQLATVLKGHGVEVIDVSSGGMVPRAVIPATPGYQVPFSERIRKESDMLTAAVGLITTAPQAEAILTEGEADVVLLGRELLRNPYFAIQAATQVGEDVTWPLQYLRAKPPLGR
ncbi:NADH:flavin oxidoreductase/NADH oxidase [Parapedobacter sp. ISTM3]|uniref:NADH:flavin oxidoreductase/NADH oxidase n=1 Tax=Parapedobacter sp. ISTM3 TaxID=2800130 RepID=UPI001904CA46|nr:NADH:flavin oxidoreductase/NADH oxidase [Parapedobacter sp. ISTM3]MBK1438619.1 NADH:flavin oxidoreductase/NADH oxidase [Parapedobacter sp. ISTM3]